MCERMIKFNQISPSVIEHIVVILISVAKYTKTFDATCKVFLSIISGTYSRYALDFIERLLKNIKILDLKAYAAKDLEKMPKFSCKLKTDTISIKAQECLESMAFVDSPDNSNMKEEAIKHLRTELVTGTVFLLGVIFIYIIENNIKEYKRKVGKLQSFNCVGINK